MPQHQRDWQHLAEQASKETNPAKHIRLIEELNRVLREERQGGTSPQDHASMPSQANEGPSLTFPTRCAACDGWEVAQISHEE